ncbi:MAG: hypothetical protein LBK76_03450 [Verrucomicrobiales bacterium]|jgi:hypothetical protein|nr:hypothetical protein [Verrucomicrobiales bacterium]
MAAAQKGIKVEIETRPTFTGYINLAFGEEDKFRVEDELEDESGVICTVTGNDSTQEVSQAQLVVKQGTALPQKFDVLTESGASGRKWLIRTIGRPREAGKKVLVNLKLWRNEGNSLT